MTKQFSMERTTLGYESFNIPSKLIALGERFSQINIDNSIVDEVEKKFFASGEYSLGSIKLSDYVLISLVWKDFIVTNDG
jgi:hypothetical protein